MEAVQDYYVISSIHTALLRDLYVHVRDLFL